MRDLFIVGTYNTKSSTSLPIYLFLILSSCFLNTHPLVAQDSDGDTIADNVDLDDDNDGILDTDEGHVCPSTNLGLVYVNTGDDELATYDLDNNTTNVLCSNLNFTGGDIAIAPDGQIYLAEFENNNPELIRVDPVTCAKTVIGVLPTPGGDAPNSFTFLPDGTALVGINSQEEIYRVTISPFSYTLWQSINGYTSSGDFVLVDGKIYYLAETSSQRVLEITVDASYNYVSHTDLGSLSIDAWGAAVTGSCQLVYGSGDDIRLITDVSSGSLAGTTITSNVSGVGDIYGFTSISEADGCNTTCTTVDTDGDGVPNHLDLDSDGDGCPDAIEGAGSFTSTNMVSSSMPGGNSGIGYTGSSSSSVTDNLGNIVDANGVPTSASGGQGVGDAHDGSTNSQCPTCNAGSEGPKWGN